MDLLTYLRRFEPEELVHIGGDTYATRTHDSLKISNGKWCWWSRNIGGTNALDYLTRVEGLSFLDAVQRILGELPRVPPTPMRTAPLLKTEFTLPPKHADTRRVFAYLRSRGVDAEIINHCIKHGQLYEDAARHKSSRILLHKVDKTTGKGIYGAVFLLYDSDHNPIGEYVTDQDGYIYADEGLADGRYYLREIKAAPGYVLDPELKTIYVRYGSTTEIEWSNTAECGQIQVIKKSANDNPINGLPAGTLLEGAVFEIYDKAGNVVDTIKSDRNGRAISKTLPLSRYTVREIKAPANYSINPTVMTAYLEFNGQIVTFEVQNTSVSTGVSIKKTGPVQAVPGQPIRYVFSQIKNGSNVSLDSFYWRDQIPAQITLNKLVTGSYNQQQNYKVVYKTNLSEDYRTLADNLSTSKVYVLDARPAVLGLAANERVTEIMFVFGNVRAGFAQVETPCIYATARSGLANNSSIVNVADVGGLYNGQWIQAVSRWLTTVYTKTTVKLPKTGY